MKYFKKGKAKLWCSGMYKDRDRNVHLTVRPGSHEEQPRTRWKIPKHRGNGRGSGDYSFLVDISRLETSNTFPNSASILRLTSKGKKYVYKMFIYIYIYNYTYLSKMKNKKAKEMSTKSLREIPTLWGNSWEWGVR